MQAPVERNAVTASRVADALQVLKHEGALRGRRSHRLSARVDPGLLEAARRKLGTGTDTEVVSAALAVLAGGDDFGRWLVSQKGSLPRDFELPEF